MSDRNPLYQAAIDADERFSEVLTREGFKSRWDSHRLIMANPRTRAAYLRKLDADDAWLNYMRSNRIA